MKPISNEDFGALCFAVLMENGSGVSDKAPYYISEKKRMIEMGYEAFALLDLHNMRKIKAWCQEWDVEMPKECADHLDASEAAYKEMQERMPGFEL